MANTKKCKHPSCSCQVSDSTDYCSPQCAAMEKTPDLDCKCPHAGCSGHLSATAKA
jgi:hypothetical protein